MRNAGCALMSSMSSCARFFVGSNISSHQFAARHPDLLGVGAVGGALQETLQALFVVEDEQAGQEDAVEPGKQGFRAFAQGEAQATSAAREQRETIDSPDMRGKIRLLCPARSEE